MGGLSTKPRHLYRDAQAEGCEEATAARLGGAAGLGTARRSAGHQNWLGGLDCDEPSHARAGGRIIPGYPLSGPPEGFPFDGLPSYSIQVMECAREAYVEKPRRGPFEWFVSSGIRA